MSDRELSVDRSISGMVYTRAFEALLRQNSLFDFDRVMQIENCEVIKHAVPERSTVRVRLKQSDEPVMFYLKRHYVMPLLKFLGQVLKCARPKTAFDEFKNITAFHRAGIPTMVPVAAGIRRRGLLRTESFLVTKALEGCTRLDHLFAEDRPESIDVKQDVIYQAAFLVSKMHAAGFNHRDLYLCHILRDRLGRLYFVDLHRVDRRRAVPERWRVKDVAALHYSAPEAVFSRTDRIRFLKAYLGVERLSRKDKQFALKVLKKSEKMVHHNRKRRKCT